LHRGELSVQGNAATGVRFRHADGTLYGALPDPREHDLHAKLFGALRHLGFRERDIRAVLSELRTDAELGSATAESLLRAALQRLTRPAVQR
jgi:Holliday junction resolvasome RuvABC DNA-binding subunit